MYSADSYFCKPKEYIMSDHNNEKNKDQKTQPTTPGQSESKSPSNRDDVKSGAAPAKK